MSLPTGPLGWWQSIVRTTWLTFMVMGGAVGIAFALHYYRGDYEWEGWREIGVEVAGALLLMFTASFLMSLMAHRILRRESRWPGGGGPKNR